MNEPNKRTVHRLTFELDFPCGLTPGESVGGNFRTVARDGRGRPVLRGSSLAGVLRSAWHRHVDGDERSVERFFGACAGDDYAPSGQSPLQVPDCILATGDAAAEDRTFHQRHRHLGRVMEGGLYGTECLPPHTVAGVTLWLDDESGDPDGTGEFLGWLAATVKSGVHVGGMSSRGTGLGELVGTIDHRAYDLSDIEQHAAYLDDHRRWRMGEKPTTGSDLAPSELPSDTLRVTLRWRIPRGQDLLVGDGQGIDFESEPQRVMVADGNEYWRLPGSTMRGLYRSWCNRLAARDGLNVADSAERHVKREEAGTELKGDMVGWLFEKDRPAVHDESPVARLFGSLHKAGRIWFSDAYSPVREDCLQKRNHVAVDQLTGGAVEHLLFDNAVLVGDVEFTVRLQVQNPSEQEVRWLAQTTRAIDMGLLRVGSSKSAGRLSLCGPPCAEGPHRTVFNDIQPLERGEE